MARGDGEKMRFIEEKEFLDNLTNPYYSWIISYHLLKRAFSNSEGFENNFFEKTQPYDPNIDAWLNKANFLDENSPRYIHNRYIAIRDFLITKNPERIVNFGCGLSPLGLSIHSRIDSSTIVDSDIEEVISYRYEIIKNSGLSPLLN